MQNDNDYRQQAIEIAKAKSLKTADLRVYVSQTGPDSYAISTYFPAEGMVTAIFLNGVSVGK